MDENNPETEETVATASLASVPQPGDDKYAFYYTKEHPTEDRLQQIFLSAAWGRTPELALKELFQSYKEHDYTRPIKEWKEAQVRSYMKIDTNEDGKLPLPKDPLE